MESLFSRRTGSIWLRAARQFPPECQVNFPSRGWSANALTVDCTSPSDTSDSDAGDSDAGDSVKASTRAPVRGLAGSYLRIAGRIRSHTALSLDISVLPWMFQALKTATRS